MRYQPESPPLSSGELGEYLLREFQRIAQTLDHPQATQINYGREVDNNATGSALTINWKAGQKQRVDMSAACTFTFAPPEGVCNLMLKLAYAGDYAPTFPSTVKWQGGTVPTWTKANGAVDVIAMYFDGTNYHATASLNSK
jgi:hypothetical protein